MTYKYIAICLLYITHYGLLSHDARLHAPTGNVVQPSALSADKKQLTDPHAILRSLVKNEDRYMQHKQATLEEHVAYNNKVESACSKIGLFLGACITLTLLPIVKSAVFNPDVDVKDRSLCALGAIPACGLFIFFYNKLIPQLIKGRFVYHDIEQLSADVNIHQRTLQQLKLALELLKPNTNRETHDI